MVFAWPFRGLVYFVLVISHGLQFTTSSTHWVVTEEGKIQAQVNSIFHMKRPYDLVAFLEQERRVSLLDGIKTSLSETSNLEAVAERHDPDFEAKFYEDDRDCQLAGMPLAEFDLFVSTLIQPDPLEVEEVLDILRDEHADNRVYEQPLCSIAKPQHFELDIIDDLSSTERREVLKMTSEVGLTTTVLEHGRFHLAQYGQLVTNSVRDPLKEYNWVGTLMASNYWRLRGKAKEAVDCLRKVIHYAPVQFKHIGLLSLANVFHRSHNSEDAIEVLKLAVRYAPKNPALHFTMGNVYATIFKFNESAQSYDTAVKLQPSFQAARLRKHAVLCHEKFEQALEDQHKSLQATLKELNHYKKQHESWSSLLNKIINEQATVESRMASRMEYEKMRIYQSADGKGQDCVQFEEFGHTIMSCSLQSENDKHKDMFAKEDSALDLEKMLKTFELKVESINQGGGDESGGDSEEDLDLGREPSKSPKYAKWPKKKFKLKEGWPTESDCAAHFNNPPKWNEYPTVFLSPENKGFDVAKMMSSDIELPLEHPAPLPWYPPTCTKFEGKTKYDHLQSLARWTHINIKKAEREIEATYYLHSSEKNFHEWGSRVKAAMNKNVAPKWVVYLLAGTYWRIWGHPQNGIHCYRRALDKVPQEYLSVVLTNLAGLLYKTGTVDDALSVMRDVMALDNKDPDSNFLIGNLLSAKGNMTGAKHHYLQALRMNPDHKHAMQFLHVPACHMKFKTSKPNSSSVNTKINKKPCSDENAQNDGNCPGAVRDDIAIVDDTKQVVYCKDGHCRFVTPEEFLAISQSDEIKFDQDFVDQTLKKMHENGERVSNPPPPKKSSSSKKSKKSSGKNKKKKRSSKKQKGKEEEREKIVIPEEGEQTVLMDREHVKKTGLPMGAVEVGTIAENDDDQEFSDYDHDHRDEHEHEAGADDLTMFEGGQTTPGFIGPVHLVDDPVPDVMININHEGGIQMPPYEKDCNDVKDFNWDSFTSTWLSVSAKNIDIREFLGDYLEPLPESMGFKKPFCDEVPTSLLSLDHLEGVKMRDYLHVASESGLKEAFQGLAGEKKPMGEMATRITLAMKDNSTSWVLSTAAALYWRVKGQATEAVQCLRHALYHAPRYYKDIPLLSLANIMHRAGLYNDALIAGNMALEISPKFVVIHFTMGNIYMSKNDPFMALHFYMSTVNLQQTFEPAVTRILALNCQDVDRVLFQDPAFLYDYDENDERINWDDDY